jgi:rod shape-determining protein MreC
MASPNTGRRSYARRAQYGAFAAYIIAIAGGLAGLLAAIVWVVDPVGFGNLRTLANEIVAPASRVVNGGTGSVDGIGDRISAWWNAGAQNRELRERLTTTQREVARARGLQAENRQLRALLGLAQGEVRPVAVARLLSTSGTSTRRYAILDAGFADGVRTGQPVRSDQGLIGRTLEVGPSVARVLLITDQRNVVPARRASDGLGVLVTGRGDNLLDVRTLDSATINLKVGDVLLASGTGGLYQPRTPVGRIVRLTRDGALAVPLAQPTAAVAVIVEPASDADVDTPPPATEEVEGSGE